ncbi:MAG: glycoside hydrolase family 28 protein [Phycisphaerae bacterium]
MSFDIRDYGARPENPVNTSQIQQALDAAGQAGGGRVVVPAGVFKTGTIELRSGVELYVSAGATLLGTNNPADYPPYFLAENVKSRRPFQRRMILASGCRDVAVTGPGVIDGDGGCIERTDEISGGNEGRPLNLHFVDCRGVMVKDVKLRRAGSWMQQYLACSEVLISGITVWNHDNHTNDGLDIDGCADVRVVDCDIDSRDDALVFKSTGPAACRNIIVSNCRLRSNCHGIKFGTESVGGFENIRISNCIISPARQAIPMEGYPEGRPVITGCALECVDGGTMRGISIDGLIVEKVFAPILVKLGERLDRRLDETDPPEAGRVEDIRICNVIARQAGPISCSVTGYPGRPVRRVALSDISIEHCGGIEAGAIIDDVPENSTGYPEINMFGNKKGKHLPSWGFFFRHVDGLRLSNLHLRTLRPEARQAIVTDDVTGLVEHDIRIENPAG